MRALHGDAGSGRVDCGGMSMLELAEGGGGKWLISCISAIGGRERDRDREADIYGSLESDASALNAKAPKS